MSLRLRTVLSSDAVLAAVVTTDRSATSTLGNEHKRCISNAPLLFGVKRYDLVPRLRSYFPWCFSTTAISRRLLPLRRLLTTGLWFREARVRRLLRWGERAGSGSRLRSTGRRCAWRELRSGSGR